MEEILKVKASDNIGINTIFPEDILGWLSKDNLEKVTIISWDNVLVGYWTVSDTYRIAVYHERPGWFHRLMIRWLLGWRWEDAC